MLPRLLGLNVSVIDVTQENLGHGKLRNVAFNVWLHTLPVPNCAESYSCER